MWIKEILKELNRASQEKNNNGVYISRGEQKEKAIRKYISKNNQLQLFCICKKHKTLNVHKKKKYKMTDFWKLVL